MTVRRDLIADILNTELDVELRTWSIENLADAIDRGLPPEDADERDLYQYARGLADGLAYE